MDDSSKFNSIDKIKRFVEDETQISLSDAHKIIRQFIDRKIDYKYSGCLCLSDTYVSSNHVNDQLNPFFNKIDFENV